MRRRVLAILAALSLAACAGGTDTERVAERAGDRALVLGALRSLVAQGGTPPPAPTRAGLRAAGTLGSVLLVSRADPPVTVAFTPEVGNAGAITWRGGPATVDLRDGVASATRGLGFDLISAETAPVRAAMAAGGGTYARAIRDLDGEGRLRRIDLACTLRSEGTARTLVLGRAYAGPRYRETCRIETPGIFAPASRGGRIENTYALDSRGVIRASRQWIAPRLGYLALERTEIGT